MRRLGAQGVEATFIVDTEFKRINPLLQLQDSISPDRVRSFADLLLS
jgi:hypothetical protein